MATNAKETAKQENGLGTEQRTFSVAVRREPRTSRHTHSGPRLLHHIVAVCSCTRFRTDCFLNAGDDAGYRGCAPFASELGVFQSKSGATATIQRRRGHVEMKTVLLAKTCPHTSAPLSMTRHDSLRACTVPEATLFIITSLYRSRFIQRAAT